MKLVCYDDDDVNKLGWYHYKNSCPRYKHPRRATQGVTLMRMKEGVNVVAIARLVNEGDSESECSQENEEDAHEGEDL